MKSSLIFVICLTIFHSSYSKSISTKAGDEVPVGVYYESHDTNSINFIKNQLGLSDAILAISKIDYVPWGRAQYDASTGIFTCDNSDEECHADRIHACAYNFHPNNSKPLLQFIRCTVYNDQWITMPSQAANECANQVTDPDWIDSFPHIEMCSTMNDTEDINIFLANKDKTAKLSPPLTNVPYITINGQQNTDAVNGLKNVICNSYNGANKPSECSPGYVVPVGVYYESHDENSINFIKNQLDLSEALLAISKIDYVPWGRAQYNENNNTFTCSNSAEECHADRIHACAYTLHPNNSKSLLQFIRCTVNDDQWKTDPAEAASQCATQINDPDWIDSFPAIEVCSIMNDTEDINIFLANRDKTAKLSPPLTNVPYITINGQQNTDAQTGLKNVICNLYNGDKPSECSQPDGASVIAINKMFSLFIVLIAVILSFNN